MWCVASEEKKRAFRQGLIAQRNALTADERLVRSRAIQARALTLPVYGFSRSIALYSPAGNEVDTGEILDHALSEGRKVFYPAISGSTAGQFVRVASGADFRMGQYGIREPFGDELLSAEDGAGLVVFVPGVGFDAAGNRLGRGAGWYDRILPGLCTTATLIALAYDFQLLDEVPAEAWDQRVHFIVTETKLIDCDVRRDATNGERRNDSQA
jgi:5-formyltetrahydrofolate cyclo-ligase